MAKFRALELAIEQAMRQRDDEARRHAQAQRTLNYAHGQLSQLQNYAGDTDARWIGGGHTVNLSAELIKHHYQFMDRLVNAIQQQQGVIANLERQLGLAHQSLLKAEYRLAGIKQVLKSRRAEQQVELHRREQRITDEFAAQRHARNRAAATKEELI